MAYYTEQYFLLSTLNIFHLFYFTKSKKNDPHFDKLQLGQIGQKLGQIWHGTIDQTPLKVVLNTITLTHWKLKETCNFYIFIYISDTCSNLIRWVQMTYLKVFINEAHLKSLEYAYGRSWVQAPVGPSQRLWNWYLLLLC